MSTDRLSTSPVELNAKYPHLQVQTLEGIQTAGVMGVVWLSSSMPRIFYFLGVTLDVDLQPDAVHVYWLPVLVSLVHCNWEMTEAAPAPSLCMRKLSPRSPCPKYPRKSCFVMYVVSNVIPSKSSRYSTRIGFCSQFISVSKWYIVFSLSRFPPRCLCLLSLVFFVPPLYTHTVWLTDLYLKRYTTCRTSRKA